MGRSGFEKMPKILANQTFVERKNKSKAIKRSNPAKKIVFFRPCSLMELF